MNHSPPCRCLVAIAMLLTAASVSFAQEPATVRKVLLPSLDPQAAARLRALDRRLTPVASPDLAAGLAGQLAMPGSGLDAFTPLLADPRHREIWEQLPGDYLRMIQDSGDALVTLPDAAPRLGVAWSSAQVRRLCQERLLALPRASLEAYRLRVDAEAKALLERGRQERSPLPLRRLVDELLCSRHSAAALDLLGDLAFERGHFEEARHWWRRIDSADPFHAPTMDMARAEAKQVLALIFAGRIDEAKVEIGRASCRERVCNDV